MRDHDTVTRQWVTAPDAWVEADGDAIEFVTRHRGAIRRTVLTDIEATVRQLREARAWTSAVYPAGNGGGFSAADREAAWDALSDAGEDRPNEVKVTEFLLAYRAQSEDPDGDLLMPSYAVTWRKQRYAV